MQVTSSHNGELQLHEKINNNSSKISSLIQHMLTRFIDSTNVERGRKEKRRRSSQVWHIGVAEQLGDLGGLREYVDAVEARRRVDEAEVLIGGAAEDREGRQREARGELGVDGVGETDTAVAGRRQRGGAGGGRETHGFGHGKGMKARRNGEIWGRIRVLAEEIWEKEERSGSPRGTDLEEKLPSEWRGKEKLCWEWLSREGDFKVDLVFMM